MPNRIIEIVWRRYSCMSSLLNAQHVNFDSSQFYLRLIAPPSFNLDHEIGSSKSVTFLENRSGDDDDPDKEDKINLFNTPRGNIPLGTIALDCAVSISVFTNLTLLQHIQKLFRLIMVHCRATKYCNKHRKPSLLFMTSSIATNRILC